MPSGRDEGQLDFQNSRGKSVGSMSIPVFPLQTVQ